MSNDTHSLVVYSNNKLQILPDDYSRMRDDGFKSLRCLSVHNSYAEAKAAMLLAKQSRGDA
jgi:hypothetical protein